MATTRMDQSRMDQASIPHDYTLAESSALRATQAGNLLPAPSTLSVIGLQCYPNPNTGSRFGAFV